MRDHQRKEVENHETLALERGASNTYSELQQWLKILTCFVEKVVVRVFIVMVVKKILKHWII